MRLTRFLAPAVAIVLIGCSNTSAPTDATPAVANDGITLSVASKARLTGAYADATGNLLRFDTARNGDDLYFDLTGIGGKHAQDAFAPAKFPGVQNPQGCAAFDQPLRGGRLFRLNCQTHGT